MIEKYTLYVGLNDKDTKIQKVNTVEAYKIIENLLLNLNVEGATIKVLKILDNRIKENKQ